jgi:type III pantothenate kinase
MTLLAIDVGNTRLKWAIYSDAQPGAQLLASGAEFLENIESLSEGAWAAVPAMQAPKKMIGCIVAGDAVRQRVQEQIEECWDLNTQWVLSSAQEAGLINGYDHPLRLGADRWVAMIGAWHRMMATHAAAPKPIVVTMVGTAVTVEAIGVQAISGSQVQGKFLGGFILPGHGIMLKALGHGRPACAHGRCERISHQYERCADQWRHLCDCRRRTPYASPCAKPLRTGSRGLHDGWCRLEDAPVARAR